MFRLEVGPGTDAVSAEDLRSHVERIAAVAAAPVKAESPAMRERVVFDMIKRRRGFGEKPRAQAGR